MGRVDEALRRAAEASIKDQDRAAAAIGVADVAFPTEGAATDARVFDFDPPASDSSGDTGMLAAPSGPFVRGADSDHYLNTAADPKQDVAPGLQFSTKLVGDDRMLTTSREQYRRLAATLHRIQATSGLKVVMIASAVAGEGKTLTAANLALTFSESYDKDVLLIDADLRRPSLARTFGIPGSPGLSDGLLRGYKGRLPLQRVSPRLSVLPAGRATADPMAGLTSDRMHRLIGEARDAFDWVIVDTPPIGLMNVPVGGRDINEALMRDLGVGAEEAEQLKAGGSSDTTPADQVAQVAESAAGALIEEIHHALSFFWTAATDETIDAVYLSGGVARMPGLAQLLGERVQAPVELVTPFSRVSLDRAIDTPEFRARSAEYAVAMGLATRRPEDK